MKELMKQLKEDGMFELNCCICSSEGGGPAGPGPGDGKK
jgi:hypothetical protein